MLALLRFAIARFPGVRLTIVFPPNTLRTVSEISVEWGGGKEKIAYFPRILFMISWQLVLPAIVIIVIIVISIIGVIGVTTIIFVITAEEILVIVVLLRFFFFFFFSASSFFFFTAKLFKFFFKGALLLGGLGFHLDHCLAELLLLSLELLQLFSRRCNVDQLVIGSSGEILLLFF